MLIEVLIQQHLYCNSVYHQIAETIILLLECYSVSCNISNVCLYLWQIHPSFINPALIELFSTNMKICISTFIISWHWYGTKLTFLLMDYNGLQCNSRGTNLVSFVYRRVSRKNKSFQWVKIIHAKIWSIFVARNSMLLMKYFRIHCIWVNVPLMV